MDIISLFFLALGLAMDAFAVSVSNGICYSKATKKQALLTAFTFGLFQGVMPMIGFLAGQAFRKYIEPIDHWVALALLVIIGGNMILEAVRELRHPEECEEKSFSVKVLLIQAVATSIDALAVGIGLAAMKVNLWLACGMIAVVAFICSLIGVRIGKSCKQHFKEKAEIIGGLILIILGIKIFLEHMLG